MESKDQPDMNVDVPKEEAAATETPIEPEKPKGKPISSLVNQEFVTMIMDMGFTKAVAEKSLLFTNNTSVEGAMEWITQHQDDADFLEEEFLAEDVTDYDPNKPHLSKEERMQRALELQKAAREKRLAEEKKLEEEREKNRIHGTKELLKAKKIMDEQQAKLALEMQKREKMEFIKEKKRMEELLKKEAAERAGKKYRKSLCRNPLMK